MFLTEFIKTQINKLRIELAGRPVGIIPADFPMHKDSLLPLLSKLNVKCIYSREHVQDLYSYPCCGNPEEFTGLVEICVSLGYDPDNADLVAALKKANIPIFTPMNPRKEYRLLQPTEELHVLHSDGMGREAHITCNDLVVSVEYIRQAFEQDYNAQEDFRTRTGIEAPSRLLGRRFAPFETTALESACVFCPCPVCGKVCVSQKGFLVPHSPLNFIAPYWFNCCTDFYLLKALPSMIGMYLPKQQTIIDFLPAGEYRDTIFSELQLRKTLNRFQRYILYNIDAVEKYTADDKLAKARLFSGIWESMSYNIQWDLAAIHSVCETGVIEDLDEVLITQSDHLGVHELFPEASNLRKLDYDRHNRDDRHRLFRESIASGKLPVLAHHVLPLSNTYAHRLTQCAASQVSELVREQIEDAKQHSPLIWITLRNCRKWSSQVEGTCRILLKLQAVWPTLAAAFDGILGEVELSQFNEIKERLDGKVRVYNAIGCSKHETILWCDAIDAHFSHLGNGNIFPAIANKPGIFHSNSILLRELYPGKNGNEISVYREGNARNQSCQPVEDANTASDDYELDWIKVAQRLHEIIQELGK